MRTSRKQKENKRKKQLTLLHGLEIRNLTFGYQKDIKIFEDASVEIPAGKTIAIIGPSGSGKTTFLDLLLGLLKPETGSIIYDDYDIVSERDKEGECIASIGDVVSYIPQTVYLNGETIRNNVAFYETEESIDEERVCKCLQQAQIWKEVTQMPLGINTLIGENGLAISGGQRQRIALARALYKNFEILIMDEATASLDNETDAFLQQMIRKQFSNCTTLTIAHRLNTIMDADRVCVMDAGKVAEYDTPYNLLHKNGIFKGMVLAANDPNLFDLVPGCEEMKKELDEYNLAKGDDAKKPGDAGDAGDAGEQPKDSGNNAKLSI